MCFVKRISSSDVHFSQRSLVLHQLLTLTAVVGESSLERVNHPRISNVLAKSDTSLVISEEGGRSAVVK